MSLTAMTNVLLVFGTSSVLGCAVALASLEISARQCAGVRHVRHVCPEKVAYDDRRKDEIRLEREELTWTFGLTIHVDLP